MKKMVPYVLNSISGYHAVMNLSKPYHPLISLVKLEDFNPEKDKSVASSGYNFHSIFLERNVSEVIDHGQKTL